jgi:hypothetical protein
MWNKVVSLNEEGLHSLPSFDFRTCVYDFITRSLSFPNLRAARLDRRLYLEHFLAARVSSMHNNAQFIRHLLSWDTRSPSREWPVPTPSVAMRDDSISGVLLHTATLLPHDMLKVYSGGKRKEKPRKHGRWSVWIPGFMSGWLFYARVCDLINTYK